MLRTVSSDALRPCKENKGARKRTRSLSTLGLLCRLSVHITSASAEPTANCARAFYDLGASQHLPGLYLFALVLPGRSACVGSTSKAVCLGATAERLPISKVKVFRCEGLTCKLVQVNGKWNALSTCLLYLPESATHCHYFANSESHSHHSRTLPHKE